MIKNLLFILPTLFHLPAFSLTHEDLKPFQGYFRTKAYNGLDNTYSGKFFLPSINLERSNKLKNANGDLSQVLAFNFEVPIEETSDSIFLKFLFVEVPIDASSILKISRGVEVSFKGLTQERVQNDWILCDSNYRVQLKKLSATYLWIEFKKTSQAPCQSESHDILAERVFL